MIKKSLIKLGAFSALMCGLCSAGAISADAATVDDVAATARRLGFPESVIQQGYNEYYADPDMYTPEDLDYAISYLIAYESDIKQQLGISTEPTSTATTVSATVTSTAASGSSAQTTTQTVKPTEPASSSSGSPSGTASSESGSSQTDVRGGLTESDFINMSLEEKRDYVSKLSPDEQQQFFNTLSPDELKSIVKQLPTDDKAVAIDNFVKAGEAMGIKVTVDSIIDDTISMSMRNSDGELVDVASVGVIVEDTGYDYRGLLALSGAFILAAAGGLWLIIRKCFRKAGTGAGNEK